MFSERTPNLEASIAGPFEVAHLVTEWVKPLLTGWPAPDWLLSSAETAGQVLLYLLTIRLLWMLLPSVALSLQYAGLAVGTVHATGNAWAIRAWIGVKRSLCALLENIRDWLSSD